MAALIKATVCPGGGHINLVVTGDIVASKTLSPDDLAELLAQADRGDLISGALKEFAGSRTPAQFRSALLGRGIEIIVRLGPVV